MAYEPKANSLRTDDMRIQINLRAWFVLMAVAAIIAYRLSRQLQFQYLEKFAESHAETSQTLVQSRSFTNENGER